MNKADWQQLKMELHDKLIAMKINNDLTDNEIRKLLFQTAYLFINKRSEGCKHKWIDMEDGSLDRFCVKCSFKQMQSALKPLTVDAAMSSTLPAMRETIEVPFYTGSEHIRITVDKENFMRDLHKEMGLYPSIFKSAGR